MLIKHLFLILTPDTETSLSSFPQRQAFSLFQTWGLPLNPTAVGRGCQRFQYCTPGSFSKQREEEVKYNPSLSDSGLWGSVQLQLVGSFSWILFRLIIWKWETEFVKESQREGKAWKHSSCLEWWGLCSAQAGELVGSPAWKVQLKEATPALSEREKSSTASLGLPEQQRQERNHPLDSGTQKQPYVREGTFASRFAGKTEVGHGSLGGIRSTRKCR